MPPLALAREEKEATLEMLRHFPAVAVYGLLLTHDPKHPLSQLVSERWSELHHLTGDRFLLVAFQPPANWSQGLESFWKKQLGKKFKQIWSGWQQGPEPGVAYDYLDLFKKPKLKVTQLPCLVLFTDLKHRQAVVRSLPAWDTDSLYELLAAMFEEVRQCADQPSAKRMACLEKTLTSPGAHATAFLAHTKKQALDYLKRHPAQVVVTAASFALTLATANVIPLSASMVLLLQATKDSLSSDKAKKG